MSPTILDCTPQMAGVVCSVTPRPRERRKRENAFRWLVDATPAWPRVLKHLGLDGWPDVTYLPDLKPPASVGLTEFPTAYSLTWKQNITILFVNADGTRAALIDPVVALGEAWKQIETLQAKLSRAGAGRPTADNPPPTAEAARLRAYREKLKRQRP